MQLKLFVLPIKNLGAAEAEMNGLLRGHRVLAVKKEFVPDGHARRQLGLHWRRRLAAR